MLVRRSEPPITLDTLVHTPNGQVSGISSGSSKPASWSSGCNGGRAVEVEHGVELPRQDGVEVVAEALGLRLVDDADGALQPRVRERLDRPPALAEIEHEVGLGDARCLVEEMLRTIRGEPGSTRRRRAGPSHSVAAVTVPS